MRTSFSWAQFELSSTPHKMLMILGLLAVLLVPLPSLITEGKNVNCDIDFARYENLFLSNQDKD